MPSKSSPNKKALRPEGTEGLECMLEGVALLVAVGSGGRSAGAGLGDSTIRGGIR